MYIHIIFTYIYSTLQLHGIHELLEGFGLSGPPRPRAPPHRQKNESENHIFHVCFDGSTR